jgi:sporulation protein YlmC with PRC-barrel domain
MPNVNPQVLSATTMIGDEVKNADGESLGKIEEIMIDRTNGHVAYAVLSFGGFLGVGNKLFAVPWNSLTLNAPDHSFRLDVDKERLENAPGFDKDNWPKSPDRAFIDEVYTFYDVEPYYTSHSGN